MWHVIHVNYNAGGQYDFIINKEMPTGGVIGPLLIIIYLNHFITPAQTYNMGIFSNSIF